MLREYLTNIADQFRTHLDTTEPINAQDFAGKVEDVAVRYNQLGFTSGYNQGLEEGLAQAIAEGRKAKYIEEYFTGSKQYLTYSIDFEPKLIVFLSNDGLTDYETNKPNTNNPIAFKQMIDCKLGFAEGQNYLVRGATAYKYDTKSYTVATGVFTNCVFNQTTGKWDVTLGRADTSTATLRFVSNGEYPNQILFVGEKEKEEEQPSVLEGTTTITETSKILTIEGLPKAPKEFHLHAYIASLPTDDNQYFIRGLDYYKDGFIANNRKRLAVSYYTVTENVSNMYAANGSVSEITQNSYNVFSFENGTFKIDFSYSDPNCFGANNSYKWTATF